MGVNPISVLLNTCERNDRNFVNSNHNNLSKHQKRKLNKYSPKTLGNKLLCLHKFSKSIPIYLNEIAKQVIQNNH